MPNYVMRVHQYTDSFSGHVNVEYLVDGASQGFYGADITGSNGFGLSGGVFDQTAASTARIQANPGDHTFVDVLLSSANYHSSIQYSIDQSINTLHGLGDYDLIFQNCVDFFGETLAYGGLDKYSTGDYLLQDYSLTNVYAETRDFVLGNTVDSHLNWNFHQFSNGAINFSANNFSLDLNGDWSSVPTQVYDSSWLVNYIEQHYLGDDGTGDETEEVAEEFEYYSSPISIDLDGDGIQTISMQESEVIFDINGDGIVESTGWLSGSDGFLVYDSNGNGVIDSANEMFGGLRRGDGYSKLSSFDSNEDGVINASDAQFSSLQVWQDANINGTTQLGELSSLLELGLSEISLDYEWSGARQAGNLIGEVSDGLLNGSHTEVADVYFRFAPTEESLSVVPSSASVASSDSSGFDLDNGVASALAGRTGRLGRLAGDTPDLDRGKWGQLGDRTGFFDSKVDTLISAMAQFGDSTAAPVSTMSDFTRRLLQQAA